MHDINDWDTLTYKTKVIAFLFILIPQTVLLLLCVSVTKSTIGMIFLSSIGIFLIVVTAFFFSKQISIFIDNAFGKQMFMGSLNFVTAFALALVLIGWVPSALTIYFIQNVTFSGNWVIFGLNFYLGTLFLVFHIFYSLVYALLFSLKIPSYIPVVLTENQVKSQWNSLIEESSEIIQKIKKDLFTADLEDILIGISHRKSIANSTLKQFLKMITEIKNREKIFTKIQSGMSLCHENLDYFAKEGISRGYLHILLSLKSLNQNENIVRAFKTIYLESVRIVQDLCNEASTNDLELIKEKVNTLLNDLSNIVPFDKLEQMKKIYTLNRYLKKNHVSDTYAILRFLSRLLKNNTIHIQHNACKLAKIYSLDQIVK